MIITHADDSRVSKAMSGVCACVCVCVCVILSACLSVCPHDKIKMAELQSPNFAQG